MSVQIGGKGRRSRKSFPSDFNINSLRNFGSSFILPFTLAIPDLALRPETSNVTSTSESFDMPTPPNDHQSQFKFMSQAGDCAVHNSSLSKEDEFEEKEFKKEIAPSKQDMCDISMPSPVSSIPSVSEMYPDTAVNMKWCRKFYKTRMKKKNSSENNFQFFQRKVSAAASHVSRRSKNRGLDGSRRCHSCGTRNTPCWRTGWSSLNQLCNSCGLRLAIYFSFYYFIIYLFYLFIFYFRGREEQACLKK